MAEQGNSRIADMFTSSGWMIGSLYPFVVSPTARSIGAEHGGREGGGRKVDPEHTQDAMDRLESWINHSRRAMR